MFYRNPLKGAKNKLGVGTLLNWIKKTYVAISMSHDDIPDDISRTLEDNTNRLISFLLITQNY